jgi:Ferredoxin-like domain in Api92-like protein
MPNWVNNTLKVIKGDPKEIFEFVRTEESVFDFNTLVPMPEQIKNSKEEVDMFGLKVPAWYAWSCDNWGTKWNAGDAKYSTEDPDHVIWFDTAWDPPVPVFEALAKRFRKHEIVVHSHECMNHLHVTFTLKEGELTWTADACLCFEEDESPLTKAELEVFGTEDAP